MIPERPIALSRTLDSKGPHGDWALRLLLRSKNRNRCRSCCCSSSCRRTACLAGRRCPSSTRILRSSCHIRCRSNPIRIRKPVLRSKPTHIRIPARSSRSCYHRTGCIRSLCFRNRKRVRSSHWPRHRPVHSRRWRHHKPVHSSRRRSSCSRSHGAYRTDRIADHRRSASCRSRAW